MFELRRELGRGAHGMVFEARQLGLDRQVAIKMLLPHALSEEGIVERFKREARLASSLTNLHSVIIHAFGVHAGAHDQPMPYLAMEYLHGEDLANYLADKQRLSVEETAIILRQVLASLAEAHRKGIVHRDLKPENIFLSQRDDDFVVKVLDFGIAKVLEGEVAGGRRLTEEGVVCGTPEYMSPEQAKGMTITPAADIYALGCIAYQLLTGSPPFHGTNPMTVALKHCQAPIPPLPEPAASSAFGVIVPKAMAKEPHERYRDASELLSLWDQTFGTTGLVATSGSWPRTVAPSSPDASIPEWALATTPSARAFRLPTPGGVDVPAATMTPPGRDRRFYVAVGEPDDDFPIETSDQPTLMDPENEWEPEEDEEPEELEESPPPMSAAVSVRTGRPPGRDRPHRAEDRTPTVPTMPQQQRPWQQVAGHAREAIDPKERKLFLALFAGLAVLLVVVSLTVGVLIVASLPSDEAPVVAKPSAVSLMLASNPPGVEVYEGEALLGQTPLTLERPRGGGEVRLSFRREGYKTREVVLTTDGDRFETVKLERVAGDQWVSPLDGGSGHE